LFDCGIEVAMFHPQLGEQVDDFSVILNLHGLYLYGVSRRHGAVP
jgi:hypothetical protein